MTKDKVLTERVEITYPRGEEPIETHSNYALVVGTTIIGHNVLRMEHSNGEVSMVALGEGYTVSFSPCTDS